VADPAYQRVIHQLADLGRKMGQMVQYGTVKEVKKDKFRAVIGKGSDGEEVLGPWLDTANQRGGARERRFYKKGQNVVMLMPTGDPAQAVQLPFAPNNEFKPPDHANNTGQDEEPYQLEDLRVRKKGKGYEIWLEPPDRSTGGGGAGGSQGSAGNNGGNGNGVNEKVFLQKDSVTGRVGKNWFVAHKKGAKLQAGNDFAAVTEGKLICSRAWEIGKDPIQQDDKGQQGGQESTSGGKGSGST
jgi:hypothetical protein